MSPAKKKAYSTVYLPWSKSPCSFLLITKDAFPVGTLNLPWLAKGTLQYTLLLCKYMNMGFCQIVKL